VPCSLLLLCTSGKYLTIPRTEGISTTDIVGRMLLMTRDHHATTAAVSSPTAAGSIHADGHGVSALPSTPSLGKLASSEKLTSTADEGAEAGVSADVVAAVGKCCFEHCHVCACGTGCVGCDPCEVYVVSWCRQQPVSDAGLRECVNEYHIAHVVAVYYKHLLARRRVVMLCP
jgi:hypothetical protein